MFEPRSARLAIAAIVGSCGLCAPALAQCRLGVSAASGVVVSGEDVQVSVWARFPVSAYAFAAASMQVTATRPAWTFASAGAIAGANVLGINVSQTHLPHAGIFADPANPIRVWTGTYEPLPAAAPLLVDVVATPSSFFYYPSDLTPSSVECAADPGRVRLLVNPLSVGRAAVAPGEGTSIEVVGDDLAIGRNDEEAILIALLVPAVQKVRVGVEEPDDLAIEIDVQQDGLPTEQLSLNYTKAEWTYSQQARWTQGTFFAFEGFRGGVSVGVFDAPEGRAPFELERLPDTQSSRVLMGSNLLPAGVLLRSEFDKPARAFLPNGESIEVDAVETRYHQNNLRQIGLALHAYHSSGAPELRLTIEPACRADFNADGVVNSQDFFGFLSAFFAQDAAADFNADGDVGSPDFFEFLAVFFRGC